MGDFAARLDELAARVGERDLEGAVEYDQVYAHYQHENLGFRHPQGGEAKWLELTMQEKHQQYLDRVADGVLDDGGKEEMIRAMEDLALSSSSRAPIGPAGGRLGRVEALHPGLLRASAHASVASDGATIYDRPGAPRMPDRDTTPGDRGGSQRGPGR